jgi:hypothetical protein
MLRALVPAKDCDRVCGKEFSNTACRVPGYVKRILHDRKRQDKLLRRAQNVRLLLHRRQVSAIRRRHTSAVWQCS